MNWQELEELMCTIEEASERMIDNDPGILRFMRIEQIYGMLELAQRTDAPEFLIAFLDSHADDLTHREAFRPRPFRL